MVFYNSDEVRFFMESKESMDSIRQKKINVQLKEFIDDFESYRNGLKISLKCAIEDFHIKLIQYYETDSERQIRERKATKLCHKMLDEMKQQSQELGHEINNSRLFGKRKVKN